MINEIGIVLFQTKDGEKLRHVIRQSFSPSESRYYSTSWFLQCARFFSFTLSDCDGFLRTSTPTTHAMTHSVDIFEYDSIVNGIGLPNRYKFWRFLKNASASLQKKLLQTFFLWSENRACTTISIVFFLIFLFWNRWEVVIGVIFYTKHSCLFSLISSFTYNRLLLCNSHLSRATYIFLHICLLNSNK